MRWKTNAPSFFAVVCLGTALLASSPNSDTDFEPVTRTGIVPDVDQVQDFSLNRAFRIFGNINGNMPASIAAQRDDGRIYLGVINPSTHNYAIVVPGGTYNVRICYGPGSTTATFDDPNSVVVASDTMRDETLSAITTHQVSGRVTGLDPGTFGSILFTSQDRRTGGSAFIFPGIGTYMAALADGTYDVAVVQIDPSFSAFSFLPVGSVTVSGSDVMMDFPVGTLATLSGTVTKNIPIPPNSVMFAQDSSAVVGSGIDCNSPLFAGGVAPVAQSGGAYQMRLLTGRSYNLAGSFPIHPADPPQIAGTWTSFDPVPVDFQGNVVRDEALSAPTDTITITGQVSPAGGFGSGDILPDFFGVDFFWTDGSSTYGCSTQTQRTGLPNADNYRLVVAKDPQATGTMTVSGSPPSP